MSETVASLRMDASKEPLNKLINLLASVPGLEFAVLVGSRADHRARPDSDWDIALQWCHAAPWNAIIGLRNRIVHDYMNIDMQRVQELVSTGHYAFVAASPSRLFQYE